MTKILAIISTHGNELLGPNVLAYMLAKRSKLLENIEFIIVGIGLSYDHCRTARYFDNGR